MNEAAVLSPPASKPDHVADAVVFDFDMFHDPALVTRLGIQARGFAETFTWKRAAEETERHLEQVRTSFRRGRSQA